FLLGEHISIAKAGTFVNIPRGTRHAFGRVNKKNAKLLATFTPAGFEKFFDEAVDLDVTDTEAYVANANALAEKYNMEIVGPPLEV
ncbi:MAG: cupin domain-containing protein, partial [Deltaproteobacteria bacterium]|nr:cupin domain-containing protein [Deltaproteobacteria bacterium]